jgi:chitinase
MASPHTAGTVALLWAAQPGYRGNIGGTEQLIKDSAVRLTTSTETCGGLWANASPNNTYGSGRIDALAAIGATGPVNQPPVVSITAPSNGAAVNCGVPVSFTATASDTDGATPSIQWTDNGAQFASGLTASKTYACTDSGSHNIVATATDSQGATDTDAIAIAIVDPNALAAPSDLTAVVSGGTVNLAWKDNSANENGFRIERKKAKGGGWRVIGSTGANVVNYADSPARGAFQYRVSAFTSTATSATSNVVQVTVN